MKSGVYKITCKENQHYYYGSSVDIQARMKSHKRNLRNGNHRNKRLQRVHDKHGIGSLVFELVEECPRDLTIEVEQRYLNEFYLDEKCMNFCRSASAPMLGINFRKDHARKIAESQMRNLYLFHFNNGITEQFRSLSEIGKRFSVRPNIASRWFKRRNLGRSHGTLRMAGVVLARKTGDEEIVLLPFTYKKEPWILAGATSKTDYYRKTKKNLRTISVAANGSAEEVNQ